MRGTERLQSLGQSVWHDNITRDLLTSSTLAWYIDESYARHDSTSNLNRRSRRQAGRP